MSVEDTGLVLSLLLNDVYCSSQFSRYALTEQKRELTLVKELVRAMRLANPGVRALQVNLKKKNVQLVNFVPVQDQIEEDDVMRWAATLSRARVTRL